MPNDGGQFHLARVLDCFLRPAKRMVPKHGLKRAKLAVAQTAQEVSQRALRPALSGVASVPYVSLMRLF